MGVALLVVSNCALAQFLSACDEGNKGNTRVAVGQLIQDKLQDGSAAPAMIVVPSGKFTMGDALGVGKYYEKPAHEVSITHCFSIGKYAVTFAEFDRFTLATGKPLVSEYKWGRNTRPVINVSLSDAIEFAHWLSAQTGQRYRLPSEAEREYAARAGSQGRYIWGDEVGHNNANCNGCGSAWDRKMTAPVGQFGANAWGLHDMHGNVWELTADCWNFTFDNAPTDGSAWREGDCTRSVLRGGSWGDTPFDLRATTRLRSFAGTRTIVIGFRLVREL